MASIRLGFLRLRWVPAWVLGPILPRWARAVVLGAGCVVVLLAARAEAQPDLSAPVASALLSPTVRDALDCLEEQLRLERGRDAILARADSLGFAAEIVPTSERGRLLREIEVVKRRYADAGFDLLLRQEACRSLAAEAVVECHQAIERLQREAARPEAAGALARWLGARERLEGALAASAVYEYPVLPTEPDETLETIELKAQYYAEVIELLQALDARIESRLDSVLESAEALRDAWQFLEDLSFADMGDPSPSGDALSRSGAEGADPLARPESQVRLGGATSDLEFALSGSPNGPEQAAAWIRTLSARRAAVREVLTVMEREYARHEARLAGSGTAPAGR